MSISLQLDIRLIWGLDQNVAFLMDEIADMWLTPLNCVTWILHTWDLFSVLCLCENKGGHASVSAKIRGHAPGHPSLNLPLHPHIPTTKKFAEIFQRFIRAGPRGRGREWATLGVHPLSWLLSNNWLEEVCGTLTKGTVSSRLLLSNQDKGCTPSVAHSLPLPLPLPPGFCSTCQICPQCTELKLFNFQATAVTINLISLWERMWCHNTCLHPPSGSTTPFCSRARLFPRTGNGVRVSVLLTKYTQWHHVHSQSGIKLNITTLY